MLFIASLELGVFFMSRARSLNPGEVRGYLAETIKSDEAGEIYKTILENRAFAKEIGTEDMLEAFKKRDVLKADRAMFDEALQKAKDDPAFKEKVLADVMVTLEGMRMKPQETKMDDVPSPGETVKTDEEPDEAPSEPKPKPDGNDPQPA